MTQQLTKYLFVSLTYQNLKTSSEQKSFPCQQQILWREEKKASQKAWHHLYKSIHTNSEQLKDQSHMAKQVRFWMVLY